MRFNTRLRPAGYTVVTENGSDRKEESDTVMCVHCGKHFERGRKIWTPWQEKKVLRGYCTACPGHLCGQNPSCFQHDARIHPYLKRIELAEAGVAWNDQTEMADRLPVSVNVPKIWVPGDK